MRCDNCTAAEEIAYTLMIYVEGSDDPVLADFCSIECLQGWTGGSASLDEWQWGVEERSQGVATDGGGRASRD